MLFGLRNADRTPLSLDELAAELAKTELICIGERHSNPHHQQVQLELLRALLDRARASGREVGIGFEMLAVHHQKYLDRFAAGKMSLRELPAATAWQETWGFPFEYYRPLFREAHRRGAALLALNAASSLVEAVAARGTAGLDRDRRRKLPDIDFANEQHRAFFEESMRNHPPTGHRMSHLYEAQLVWDETMAATAAAWISERRPLRQLVVVAGAEHCRNPAIPGRVQRRLAGVRTASAQPQLAGDGESAQPEPGYDFTLVLASEPAPLPVPGS